MEPRAADLDVINTLRSARVAAVQASAHRSLATILRSKNPADGFVYVVKLLDVHPELGKVSGRRLLNSLGLHHFSRVSDLSATEVSTIVSACGETA